MSELTVTVLRLGLLVLLWVFVLSVASVLRTDLFGTRVGKQTKLGRRSIPTYEGREVFAGRFDAYPMWSLVGSRVGPDTRVDLYTSQGVPGESDLSDPAVPGTVAMEAILHQSNLCFKDAADQAGIAYAWHSYQVGTHAWKYGDRSLRDYLPRLMRFFHASTRR